MCTDTLKTLSDHLHCSSELCTWEHKCPLHLDKCSWLESNLPNTRSVWCQINVWIMAHLLLISVRHLLDSHHCIHRNYMSKLWVFSVVWTGMMGAFPHMYYMWKGQTENLTWFLWNGPKLMHGISLDECLFLIFSESNPLLSPFIGSLKLWEPLF